MFRIDAYLEVEKELALALGWTDLRLVSTVIGAWWEGTRPDGNGMVTKGYPFHDYSRNDTAAFRLMVKHSCFPHERSDGHIMCHWKYGDAVSCVPISEHPDKETAVRYAIVKTVAAKLRIENGK